MRVGLDHKASKSSTDGQQWSLIERHTQLSKTRCQHRNRLKTNLSVRILNLTAKKSVKQNLNCVPVPKDAVCSVKLKMRSRKIQAATTIHSDILRQQTRKPEDACNITRHTASDLHERTSNALLTDVNRSVHALIRAAECRLLKFIQSIDPGGAGSPNVPFTGPKDRKGYGAERMRSKCRHGHMSRQYHIEILNVLRMEQKSVDKPVSTGGN